MSVPGESCAMHAKFELWCLQCYRTWGRSEGAAAEREACVAELGTLLSEYEALGGVDGQRGAAAVEAGIVRLKANAIRARGSAVEGAPRDKGTKALPDGTVLSWNNPGASKAPECNCNGYFGGHEVGCPALESKP